MSSSIVPSLLAFVAVLAMIPAALWLVKRAQALRPAGHGPLSVVAAIPLGARERVAVINAAGRYLVVGVTGQSMTLLACLDDWPQAQADSNAASPFAALLDRFHQNAQKSS